MGTCLEMDAKYARIYEIEQLLKSVSFDAPLVRLSLQRELAQLTVAVAS